MTSPCGLTLRKEAAFASHTSCNFSIYSRKRVKARAFGLVLMHELHVIMILLVIFHTNRCLVKSINNINYQVLFFLNVMFLFSTAENWKLVSSHQMWDRKGSNVSCLRADFWLFLDPQTAVEESIYSSVNHRSRLSDSAGFHSLSDTWGENESKSCCWCFF